MKENKLADLSMTFAIQVVNLVKELRDKKENIMSKQIARSGTSIGANIREANYASSKNDFINKLHIALKEANETGYWLELLHKTSYIDKTVFERLEKLCTEIRVVLIKSLRTAKMGRD